MTKRKHSKTLLESRHLKDAQRVRDDKQNTKTSNKRYHTQTCPLEKSGRSEGCIIGIIFVQVWLFHEQVGRYVLVADTIDDDGQGGEGDIVHCERQTVVDTL